MSAVKNRRIMADTLLYRHKPGYAPCRRAEGSRAALFYAIYPYPATRFTLTRRGAWADFRAWRQKMSYCLALFIGITASAAGVYIAHSKGLIQ